MLEIAVRGTALLLLDFENYSVHPGRNRILPRLCAEVGRWQMRDGR
jgi:hypothetical protein